MKEAIVIAIDGPVASGKGTLAPLLAEKLDGFYLYTGAMYRSVALYCIEHGIAFDNEAAVVNALSKIAINLSEHDVFLDDKNVTGRIAQQDTAQGASAVGVFPDVRKDLIKRQREIAEQKIQEGKSVVAEGRDTGTVLFPGADVKFFLTASAKVRAQRRFEQHQSRGDTNMSLATVLEDTLNRDRQDQDRAVDPLVRDPEKHGYVVIDSTAMTENETLEYMLNALKEKGVQL